jgi:hypothetical protein
MYSTKVLYYSPRREDQKVCDGPRVHFPDDSEAGDDIDGVELARKLPWSDGYLAGKALQALTGRLFRVLSVSVPSRQPNTINASLVRQGKAHSFLFLHADTAMQTQQTRAQKLDPTANAHAPFSTHLMLCC